MGLRKVRGSYHCGETFPPCGAGQRGAVAGLLFPKPLEPLAAEAALRGAKGSPPVVFPSLSGWPGCLGNQPSGARRLQLAFQNCPGKRVLQKVGPSLSILINTEGCCFQLPFSLFSFSTELGFAARGMKLWPGLQLTQGMQALSRLPT